MKDKSKLIAIILVIITILVVVISYITKYKQENQVGNINIVTNYSDFYTVDSCLYRTITYLASKDSNSLFLVTNDNFKKQNNINKETILNYFPSVSTSSTFVSKKMYYQNINDNIRKYYIFGTIEENYLLGDVEYKEIQSQESYFVVYLDTFNKTFSVEPYSKELFEKLGGDENEK